MDRKNLFIYDHINHRSMLDKMHHRDAVFAVYLVSYFFLLLVDQNHNMLDQLDCINLSILFALLQGTTLMIRSVDLYNDHTFGHTVWKLRFHMTSSSQTKKLLFLSLMSIRDHRPKQINIDYHCHRRNKLLFILTSHENLTLAESTKHIKLLPPVGLHATGWIAQMWGKKWANNARNSRIHTASIP